MTKQNKIFLKLVHKRDKVMSVSNIFRFKKQEMDHFSERKVSEYFCRFFCVYNIGFLNTTKNINSNFFKTQAGWFFVGVHLLIQEMIHSLRMCLSSHVGHYIWLIMKKQRKSVKPAFINAKVWLNKDEWKKLIDILFVQRHFITYLYINLIYVLDYFGRKYWK